MVLFTDQQASCWATHSAIYRRNVRPPGCGGRQEAGGRRLSGGAVSLRTSICWCGVVWCARGRATWEAGKKGEAPHSKAKAL